jgi:hypothetical protein
MPYLLKRITKQQEVLNGDNFGDSKESLESYTIWSNTFWPLGNVLTSLRLFNTTKISGLHKGGV